MAFWIGKALFFPGQPYALRYIRVHYSIVWYIIVYYCILLEIVLYIIGAEYIQPQIL